MLAIMHGNRATSRRLSCTETVQLAAADVTGVMHVFLCNINAFHLAPLPCNSPCTPVGATQDNPLTDYLTRHAHACKTDQKSLPRRDSVVPRIGDSAVTPRPRARRKGGTVEMPDERRVDAADPRAVR